MWFQVTPFSTTVCLNDLGAIQSNALEWVNGDEYYAAIGIDAVLSVAVSNGMEHYKYQLSAMS